MLWTDMDFALDEFLQNRFQSAFAKVTPGYCGGGGPSGPSFGTAAVFLAAPVPRPAFTMTIEIRTFVTGKGQDIVSWSGKGGATDSVELRLTSTGNLRYHENQ